MIRPVRPDDRAAVMAVAVASGLFGEEQVEEIGIGTLLDAHFERHVYEDHHWIADEEAGSLIGVAYYAPERMTEGTWNLYLIAMNRDWQGQGRGGSLLRAVENALRQRGERLLLVETSGLPDFERTRAFYRQSGYGEEARIRDFYCAGEDQIVFRKALT